MSPRDPNSITILLNLHMASEFQQNMLITKVFYEKNIEYSSECAEYSHEHKQY